MAIKGKVAPKRTIIKGRDKFPAGKPVTPQKLGISEKEFRSMVEEGSILEEQSSPERPARRQAPAATEPQSREAE